MTRDLTVRLEPPRVAVMSLHHFLNLGGSEFVVLRATPADVAAGVRVGTVSFPAFPGSGRGPRPIRRCRWRSSRCRSTRTRRRR